MITREEQEKHLEHYFEGKKFATYGSPFLNNDCLFIEFNDVLTSPFFILIFLLRDNGALNTLFNFDRFKKAEADEIYEWYVNRRTINPIMSIPPRENVIRDYFDNSLQNLNNWGWDFLYQELDVIPDIMEVHSELNFAASLTMICEAGVTKNIYVYSEYEASAIRTWLSEKYGSHVTYITGEMHEVLKKYKITSNSTFVFSDITKILTLKDVNLLNYSSVLIADRYGYNYTKDKSNYILDIERLIKEGNTFKFNCFNNMEFVENEEVKE